MLFIACNIGMLRKLNKLENKWYHSTLIITRDQED